MFADTRSRLTRDGKAVAAKPLSVHMKILSLFIFTISHVLCLAADL